MRKAIILILGCMLLLGADYARRYPTDTALEVVTPGSGDLTYLLLNQSTSQTITASPILNWLTASELLATDADKKLVSLAVATYPSLAELSYIKGVSSAIQAQINGKEPSFTKYDLAGTSNQVSLSASGTGVLLARDITLSLPQSIATTSTPQFARMGVGKAAHASTLLDIYGTQGTNSLYMSDSSGGIIKGLNVNVGGGGSAAWYVDSRSSTGASAGAYNLCYGKLEAWFYVVANNNTTGKRVMRFGNGGVGAGGANHFSIELLNDAESAVTSTPFILANDAPSQSFHMLSTGFTGFMTSAPDRHVEINDASGNCLRLTYNDSNGSAGNYADFLISSTGDLTITPSGGDIALGSANVLTTGTLGAGATTVDSLTTDTGGITLLAGQDIRPSANSTSALNIAQADGTDFAVIDTTNKRLQIGTTSVPLSTIHIEENESSTNTTLNLLRLRRLSTGTPAASMGAGILYDLEDAGGIARNVGRLQFYWTNATDKLPKFSVTVRNAAGTLTEYFTIDDAGQLVALSTYSVTVGATNRDLYIDNTGLIGYVSSSRRYKENIRDIDDTSWIYKLRPVSFDYIDNSKGVNQVGLIAEEVEKINPKIVSYERTIEEIEKGLDEEGKIIKETKYGEDLTKPETVSYDKLIVPLLKEIQNLKARIDKLENN